MYVLSRNVTGEFDEYPGGIAGVHVGNLNLELVNMMCDHTGRAAAFVNIRIGCTFTLHFARLRWWKLLTFRRLTSTIVDVPHR